MARSRTVAERTVSAERIAVEKMKVERTWTNNSIAACRDGMLLGQEEHMVGKLVVVVVVLDTVCRTRAER